MYTVTWVIWYTLNKVLKHSLNLLADLRFFSSRHGAAPNWSISHILGNLETGGNPQVYICWVHMLPSDTLKVLDPQNRPGNRSISIGYEAIKVVAGWNMLELHPNRNTVEMACHPDFSRLIDLLSEPRIYENEQFTCHDSYKGTSKSWRKFKVVLNLRSFRDWQSLKKESLEPHILYMQSLGVKVTTKKPKTWMTNGWIGRMLPTIATFGVRVALWS